MNITDANIAPEYDANLEAAYKKFKLNAERNEKFDILYDPKVLFKLNEEVFPKGCSYTGQYVNKDTSNQA